MSRHQFTLKTLLSFVVVVAIAVFALKSLADLLNPFAIWMEQGSAR